MSPDIDSDERGRTVWMWQETHTGISPTMSPPKRGEAMVCQNVSMKCASYLRLLFSIQVGQHISSMHYIRSSNSFVVFSEENEIVVVDSRFQLLHSIQLQNQDPYRSLQTWVFQHVTFIASPNVAMIVQAIHGANERLHLLFHSCTSEGSLAFLGDVETDIKAEVFSEAPVLLQPLNHIILFAGSCTMHFILHRGFLATL